MNKAYLHLGLGFLSASLIATASAGMAYGAFQQSLRQMANDPQIQLAEDAARALSSGKPINSILTGPPTIELENSLRPFLIIFDTEGKPVASDATLGGNMPQIPAGIFQYTDSKGEDLFSWEPEPNLRFASVILPYHGSAGASGYVLSARSLRESESRTQTFGLMILSAWILTILGLLCFYGLRAAIEWRYSRLR